MESAVANGVVAAEPECVAATAEKPGHTPASERVVSIDVLRGFDMCWISGVGTFFHALALATGWEMAVSFSHELEHSKWGGCTCWDLIQPLFLFIVGLTLPLMIGRRLSRGASKADVFRRLFVRMLILLVLGHFDKNGPLSFHLSQIRYTGVLERIGVSGLLAGVIIMNSKPRTWVYWIAGILLAYWALLCLRAPGQPVQSFDQGRNMVDFLDQHIMPGRLASHNHDANGWFSTPPVIATVLFGALAGTWLLAAGSVLRKIGGLVGAGCALVLLGWLWGREFPIVKNIWTSSYVLFAAGWSCLLLALFYGIVDGLKFRAWAFPFILIGMNPLVIYILRETRWVDFQYLANFFLGFSYASDAPAMAALWRSVAVLVVELIFLYWLYRKKVFWRV